MEYLSEPTAQNKSHMTIWQKLWHHLAMEMLSQSFYIAFCMIYCLCYLFSVYRSALCDTSLSGVYILLCFCMPDSAVISNRERRSNGMWILQSDKVLEHAMKVIERVFERRIREKVKIDAMQFGFNARERNYRCNLHSTADAREIWV